jgi:acyl carrier protein
MRICGGRVGLEDWFGIKFDSQTEAEEVMKILEELLGKSRKVNEEQTNVNEKGTDDVGKD